MKYHNDGVLRKEQDLTLRLHPMGQERKQKLSWMEYLPPVVLCVLLAALLMGVLFS